MTKKSDLESKYRISYSRRGMNAVLAATLAASMMPSAALAQTVSEDSQGSNSAKTQASQSSTVEDGSSSASTASTVNGVLQSEQSATGDSGSTAASSVSSDVQVERSTEAADSAASMQADNPAEYVDALESQMLTDAELRVYTASGNEVETADGTLDHTNLADGEYSLNIKMMNANKRQVSMSNGAVANEIEDGDGYHSMRLPSRMGSTG